MSSAGGGIGLQLSFVERAGCNYCSSFAPLQGCANDAWNIQCLLRQS